MMKVNEITRFLDSVAPPAMQESYDNVGLQAGNPEEEISSVLVSLDVTEDVIDEALENNAEQVPDFVFGQKGPKVDRGDAGDRGIVDHGQAQVPEV